MKRNWKRILALLLTVAMVFTMNTGVFASTVDANTGDGVIQDGNTDNNQNQSGQDESGKNGNGQDAQGDQGGQSEDEQGAQGGQVNQDNQNGGAQGGQGSQNDQNGAQGGQGNQGDQNGDTGNDGNGDDNSQDPVVNGDDPTDGGSGQENNTVLAGDLEGGQPEGEENDEKPENEPMFRVNTSSFSGAVETEDITAQNIKTGNKATFSVSKNGDKYIINLWKVAEGENVPSVGDLQILVTAKRDLVVGRIYLSGNSSQVSGLGGNDVDVAVSTNGASKIKFDDVSVSVDGIKADADGKLVACESGLYAVAADGKVNATAVTTDLVINTTYYLNEGDLTTTVSTTDMKISANKGFTILGKGSVNGSTNDLIYSDILAEKDGNVYKATLSGGNIKTSAQTGVIVRVTDGGYGTINIPAQEDTNKTAAKNSGDALTTTKDKVYVTNGSASVNGAAGYEYTLSFNGAKPTDEDYKVEEDNYLIKGGAPLSWNELTNEKEYAVWGRLAATKNTFAGKWIDLELKGSTLEDVSTYTISDGSIGVSDVTQEKAKITLKGGVSFNEPAKEIDLGKYTIQMTLVSGNDAPEDDAEWKPVSGFDTPIEFTSLKAGTDYKLYYKIGNTGNDFGGAKETKPTGVVIKTVKKYGVEFPKALSSVPYRSNKTIETIIGKIEPVAYVGASGTKIILSSNATTYKYNASATAAYNIVSGNGSQSYGSATKTNTLYTTLETSEPFKKSFDSGKNKTISVNVTIANIDGVSATATGATKAITLTDTKVYVSACDLTLTDTRLGDTPVGYNVTPEDSIVGWTPVPKQELVSSNSTAEYLAMKAFQVSGLGETVLSGNVTYKVGNGKLFVADYTKLSANGTWAGSNSNFRGLEFVNQTAANGASMTVIAKNTTLALAVTNGSIYYDDFASLRGSTEKSAGQRAILAKYIKASAGTADITTNDKIDYKFSSDGGKTWHADFDTTIKKELKSGKTVSISADYLPDSGTSVPANACVGISIEKQPIKITVDTDITGIKAGDDLSEVLKNKHVGGTITVSKNDGTALKAADKGAGVGATMTDWLTDSSVSLDAASIENINSKFNGTYEVEYTVSEGDLNKTLISDYASAISDNYTLAGGKVTGKLIIDASVIVAFYDALTGAKLAADQAIATDKLNDSITVKLLSANGAEDKEAEQWTYRRSDRDAIEVLYKGWSRGSDNYTYTFTGLGDNTKYNEKTLVDTGATSLDLYVSYLEYAEPVGKGNKQVTSTGIPVSINAISPVIYTGNKIVSDSYYGAGYDKKFNEKKGFSPVLDISLYIQGDKTTKLVEGTDYTISYKNNVNAAKATDKKAPTVTITGKGNYKGLKLTTTFTILPANIANLAKVEGKNRYVKYTNKAFDSKYYAVYTENNKKLKNKTYTLNYYDEDGKKVSPAAYTKALTEPTMFYVTAEATANQNYTGETTFVKGDEEDTSIVYGIPSNSKKLSVKGVNKKVEYNKSQTNPEKLFIDSLVVKDQNKPSNEYTGVNNKLYKVTYLKNNMIEQVKTVDSVGTYYVSVAPVDLAAMKALGGVYEPTLVKVDYKGLKIKGAIRLAKNTVAYGDTATTIDLIVSDKYTEYDDILVSYKYLSANGAEVEVNDATLRSLGGASAKIPIYKEGGSHEVTIKGRHGYSDDEIKLTYKVTAQRLKADDVTVVINGGKAVPFNAAGYNAALNGNVSVKLNSTGKAITDFTVTAKKVNKTGSDAGKATITFGGSSSSAYTGSITVPFDIAAISLSDFSTKFSNEVSMYDKRGFVSERSYLFGYSTVSGSDPEVELVQYDYTYNSKKKDYDISKAVLKAGKDYTLGTFTVVSADKIVKGSVAAAKNEAYTGSKSFTCDIYSKAVSSVLVTAISNNTTAGYETEVSNNRAKFKGTYDGTRPSVYSVKVTYKDGSTQDYTGTDAVKSVFAVDYDNNYNIGKKAKLILAYNSGKNGPTEKRYVTYYEIVGAW